MFIRVYRQSYWYLTDEDDCHTPVCYVAGEPDEACMCGRRGEGGGAPPHGQEMNEMVVIHRYVMLQGSRMKLVCVGKEKKVVGLWSRDELDGCNTPVFYIAGKPDEAGMRGRGGEGSGALPHGSEMN